jgi:hypothetical protein
MSVAVSVSVVWIRRETRRKQVKKTIQTTSMKNLQTTSMNLQTTSMKRLQTTNHSTTNLNTTNLHTTTIKWHTTRMKRHHACPSGWARRKVRLLTSHYDREKSKRERREREEQEREETLDGTLCPQTLRVRPCPRTLPLRLSVSV